jgi:hypothetical protein
MSDLRYVCAVCGGTFIDTDPDASWEEALETFTPAELHDAHVLCDACWVEVRKRVPALDARYTQPLDAYERFVQVRRELRIEFLRELVTFTDNGIELTSDALRELIAECERATSPVVEH